MDAYACASFKLVLFSELILAKHYMEGGACDENSCEAKQAFETSHAVVEIKIKTLDSQDYTCRVAKNVRKTLAPPWNVY